MYNHKESKDTNEPQRRSDVTKDDRKEDSININVIGPTSSTITVRKRDEEERGKLYNVYEISVPSKSKPNVDTPKQVREAIPENYKPSFKKPRVLDISRRLNAPPEDDVHKNVSSKKKESSQDNGAADVGVRLYRLKRDYNTFVIPTLTGKDKQPINKFSLSEDSPTSSLGDFSLDLKEPPLNKPKENKKVTFLTTHARSENRRPLKEPKYLTPETKMAPKFVIPKIVEPREEFPHSDSFNNFSDTIKWTDDFENSSLDSEISSFHDIRLTTQLDKPKEKNKVTLMTPRDRHKNEKPFMKKPTQVGPVDLKPEIKTTNIRKPTIVKPRDNLSDITKWDYSFEDSSTDSDLSSFPSSGTTLTSQLNKPEGKNADSVLLTTRRYEHKYTKIIERTITPGSLKPTKLEPTKFSPISESVDNLSDITKWHDDLGDSSFESLKSQYRPSHNSLSHFPDFLPEVNKLFAEPFGETSTLAYSSDFNDDVEKTIDTNSVVEKHIFYTGNTLEQTNSISSLEESKEKDNFDSFGKINKDGLSEIIIKPPEETETPKTNDETPSLKNYVQMKPREDYFDEHLPYLQITPSNIKPKDSVTFLNKYPSLATFTDSGRRSTISGNYFDKNIPYLGKLPGNNDNLDEINYSTILDRSSAEILDTSGQDSKTSYERYFDEHLPYLENRPKELTRGTESIPSFETYFDKIFNPESVKTKEMSTTSDYYIDKHLPFLDIKPEKVENKNEIVQPMSFEKSPDQITNPGSQQSEKSSTSSGKYFNKFLSYFIKKPDREETISTDSKGSKASSGKYFNKNISYLFKKPNKEETVPTDNKGNKEGSIDYGKYLNENIPYLSQNLDEEEIVSTKSKGSKGSSIKSEKYYNENLSYLNKKPDIEENILSLRSSSTSFGTHSDENKPLKKNTIVVSDEVEVVPYLEQSRAQFSDSESDGSKRYSNDGRTSQVKKIEPEYEEMPDNHINDENGQWILIGNIDETNPFGQQNTFDGDGGEITNTDDDYNFESDTENNFSKRKNPEEENDGNNANAVSPKPNSLSWNGAVRTNDNNTMERTSVPRSSRFDRDVYASDELQVLPLQVPRDNNAFVTDSDRFGSLENKPGKTSIVEERNEAKRNGHPYRGQSVVSEGPMQHKETIPRRVTYSDDYRTVPQTERRSLNYPDYKDKNTMTDGSYDPLNNQDDLWFGTVKSQTYGPGDIDNTSRPSKPRDSSIISPETPSPRYSEVSDDRRGPSIPGRKSTKYSEKRPSSVVSLPEKENKNLNKKSLKSADDATLPVTDKKKPKKKRFKSLHLPTSKSQDLSNFRVDGTAVMSHKPIPASEIPDYPKKDLTCSLKIKGSKINAICNLYFDPRLKELLLDQLGFIGGGIRRRRNKKKRKAGDGIHLSESTSSAVAK